ncbi:MAG: hypothetical protein IPL61_40215 [Myxococcales bacterium]|nr:hypothetical protein [Myxococcales bacterium]
MLVARSLVVVVALSAACGGDHPAPPERREPPPRRVIDPPRGDVRALPPHAITADGIGPYKLAMPMAQILSALPSGPRIALMQIPGVVDLSLVRDAGLIIGGDRQGVATFIAVVQVAVARTADGIGVGTERSTLVRTLGPAVVDDRTARDPRVWVGSALPGARFVMYADRVGALVLAARPPAVTPADGGCTRPPLPVDRAGLPATARAACLDGADAVAASGDQVLAFSLTDGKPRRVASYDVPGLRWAAPLRAASGRDELIAISERATVDTRTIVVTALTLEGGRLIKLAEVDAYELTDTSAAWIGAGLAELDLRLEVARSGDDLTIGGLMIHGAGGAVIDVAQLLTVPLRINRRAIEDRDRARPDAGLGLDAGDDAPP